ncbi:PhzF family phenazine biosynthesis protein [Clostridium sp.]|uniref:PhzF family phenazine biosynthesis protein n=1 Tax=Clostridium sp. TaxID=1506 RepID=UPI002FC8D768
MKKEVYIVNAFTFMEKGGNGAGVVADASGLSSEQMQIIAKEIGLSETAFVTKAQKDEYDFLVRFFTPTTEVDLCGHATIAAFSTLGQLGIIKGHNETVIVKQKTLAGVLDVELTFNECNLDTVLMTQATPKFLFALTVKDLEPLCEILNISIDDIGVGVSGYAARPMAVSTGLSDLILPMKSLEGLKSINPDYNALAQYSNERELVGVHAFTFQTESKTSTVATRNFGPAVGIDEESATGTANGALAAYLIHNKLYPFTDDTTIVCEQGYYMNNPSEIIAKVEGEMDNLMVKVGGKATILDKRLVDL